MSKSRQSKNPKRNQNKPINKKLERNRDKSKHNQNKPKYNQNTTTKVNVFSRLSKIVALISTVVLFVIAVLGFYFTHIRPQFSINIQQTPPHIFDADFMVKNIGFFVLKDVEIVAYFKELSFDDKQFKSGGFVGDLLTLKSIDPQKTHTARIPSYAFREDIERWNRAHVCLVMIYRPFPYWLVKHQQSGYYANKTERINHWIERPCEGLPDERMNKFIQRYKEKYNK